MLFGCLRYRLADSKGKSLWPYTECAVQALEMYAGAGKWAAAHKVAMGYLPEQEVQVCSLAQQRGVLLCNGSSTKQIMALFLLLYCTRCYRCIAGGVHLESSPAGGRGQAERR